MTSNVFKKYTLAIEDSYVKTAHDVEEGLKKPPKKVYSTMDSLLRECLLLGATKYGTNFIC